MKKNLSEAIEEKLKEQKLTDFCSRPFISKEDYLFETAMNILFNT